MNSYNCKDHSLEECKKDANCKVHGRKCIRYDGVPAGKRFRYDNGNRVEVKDEPEWAFEYNPEFDRVCPPLTRRLLNSGAYGAGFVPAFPCTNGQIFPSSVGKVFFEKADEDEWNIIKDLTQIEKNQKQKYFTYTKNRCKIPFPSGSTQAEQDLLDLLTRKGNSTPRELDQFVMDYSGMNLKQYIQTYYRNKTLSRAELVRILENAFYAVKRLID